MSTKGLCQRIRAKYCWKDGYRYIGEKIKLFVDATDDPTDESTYVLPLTAHARDLVPHFRSSIFGRKPIRYLREPK